MSDEERKNSSTLPEIEVIPAGAEFGDDSFLSCLWKAPLLIVGAVVSALGIVAALIAVATDRSMEAMGYGATFVSAMIPGIVLIAIGLVDLVVRVLPEWRTARFIRRMGSVKCRVCGYDLRGSTGRCPECGTPFRRIGQRKELDGNRKP